ncbi:MAG: hypothetical protein GTO02_16385, partial [Candidatus Dadabacteria bacterium]|nr:hypothetical protein [Candidatus Dadabacteria bacterium]NIQ15906.1 hypothetical protein [Candidatus Dadabacteria bacterium]
MSRYYLLIITIFAFAGLLVSCGKKSDTATKSPAVERSLGKVEFANSCDPKVQQTLNSSLALLHHMMYGQAETEFLKVSEMDPECPMAHWGIAMTQFHPLWAPPSHAELEKGFNAIERAIKLNPKTKREQEFVVAAKAFYDGWQTVDHKTRIAAWSEGQKLVYENNPGDIDAGAFYALSLLATAPKKIKDYTNQKLAGGLLENLIKTAPEHPGLFHYTIHAYDNPELASRAVPVARRYDKLAPNVPHALHMPSHIFVRLGYWPETIDWNIRSANAAEEQSKDFMILHYMHAVDYLVYAYLQQGQYGAVSELLEKVNRLKYHQDSFIAAYGIAAAQCRSALERGSWKEASEIAVKTHGEFPWGNYPQYEAIYFYAKGLGSVKSGDVETARVNKARLDELYSSTVDNGEVYWSVIVDAQRKTIDAWIKFISGDKDNGLQMMIAAADLEDSVDKHPVTPGSVMPARDMLGDMLLLVN